MNITLHFRKLYNHGYRGWIRVPFADDTSMGYMVSAPVVRITREDALADAGKLRAELLTENGITV